MVRAEKLPYNPTGLLFSQEPAVFTKLKLDCRSGSYTYTFLRLSDANYENVKLDGPIINQVVHPLAAADFVKSSQGQGKQVLHSCSGSMVDIDVDLKVSFLWLELLSTI